MSKKRGRKSLGPEEEVSSPLHEEAQALTIQALKMWLTDHDQEFPMSAAKPQLVELYVAAKERLGSERIDENPYRRESLTPESAKRRRSRSFVDPTLRSRSPAAQEESEDSAERPEIPTPANTPSKSESRSKAKLSDFVYSPPTSAKFVEGLTPIRSPLVPRRGLTLNPTTPPTFTGRSSLDKVLASQSSSTRSTHAKEFSFIRSTTPGASIPSTAPGSAKSYSSLDRSFVPRLSNTTKPDSVDHPSIPGSAGSTKSYTSIDRSLPSKVPFASRGKLFTGTSDIAKEFLVSNTPSRQSPPKLPELQFSASRTHVGREFSEVIETPDPIRQTSTLDYSTFVAPKPPVAEKPSVVPKTSYYISLRNFCLLAIAVAIVAILAGNAPSFSSPSVTYCSEGSTDGMAFLIAFLIQLDCVPCPSHGVCANGKFVSCELGYDKWKTQCVIPSATRRLASQMESKSIAYLKRAQGSFECGEAPSAIVTKIDLIEFLDPIFSRRPNYESAKKHFFDLLEKNHQVTKIDEGFQAHSATYSFACSARYLLDKAKYILVVLCLVTFGYFLYRHRARRAAKVQKLVAECKKLLRSDRYPTGWPEEYLERESFELLNFDRDDSLWQDVSLFLLLILTLLRFASNCFKILEYDQSLVSWMEFAGHVFLWKELLLVQQQDLSLESITRSLNEQLNGSHTC
jgi:hypothetical protein